MPSANKHLRNARRNYDAAVAGTGEPAIRSWAAVALFYAAHQLVHAVLDGEDVLAQEMRHPESHGSTATVKGTSALVAQFYRDIDLAYKSLFAAGKGVRYEGLVVAESDFNDLMNKDYAAVAAWARDKLTKRGRTLDSDWP